MAAVAAASLGSLATPALAAIPDAPTTPLVEETGENRVGASKAPMPGWPLVGPITSGFGPRGSGLHTGLDIDGDIGDQVVAALPGEVIHTGGYFGYGETVIVDHGDGLSSLYGHLSRIDVAPGERLDRSDPVGLVGCSGECTGDHLHFEIRIEDEPVDPTPYLKRDAKTRPSRPALHVFGPAR